MTSVLIIGGGGMVGQKIADRLANNGLHGKPVEHVTLFDLHIPTDSAAHDSAIRGGLGDKALLTQAIELKPDVIIHLAAVVSGEAEQDFEMGWRINMWEMWGLLEAVRAANEASAGEYRPRFLFASSIAVFGGPLPEVIPDNFHSAPQSSYGNQKVIGEMFVNDYSRKGYIDGMALRLPTITVRPGKPNKAASSCFSGIIREPLNGLEAILPISESTRHMHASPRSAAKFFTHAAELNTAQLNNVRTVTLPSVSCTIAEQIEVLREVAGSDAVALIKKQPDSAVAKIVESWPRAFITPRARELGFTVEQSYSEIVQVYMEDDLGKS